MNYFPCNDIGISVDGAPHRGKLKIRNEYIPICCPTDIYRVKSTESSAMSVGGGCISLGGELKVLAQASSGTNSMIANLNHNTWSLSGKYISGLINKVGVSNKRCCNIGGDVYVSYMWQNPTAAEIKKVNADGTTTTISYTPANVYGGYIASFVNSNGDNCIVIANNNVKTESYFYNLNTKEWTKFTLELPNGYTVGNIYSSNEENVIFCISSDGRAMYKYDFSSNTYTNISYWSTLTENQNKVGRVNYTNWRIPIVCNGKTYHVVYCNIDTNYYNSNWQTRDVYVILDENGKVIFVPRFEHGNILNSVCGHDNCIYLNCEQFAVVGNQSSVSYLGRCKFYKFDPKTRRMYDMSIPHLVIDE